MRYQKEFHGRGSGIIKSLYLVIVLALFCSASNASFAQRSSLDVVHLKNGSIIRGSIVELVPDSVVKIRTSDGSLFVYEMTEVDKIEKALPEFRRRSPYAVHKRIARVGFATTLASTFVGSLAMNDDYFATTVIPVVGPFVTIIRIENDSRAYYRPGGKQLLIASGVLQTGFMIYYVTSLLRQNSFNKGFTVAPSLGSVGMSMRYRF